MDEELPPDSKRKEGDDIVQTTVGVSSTDVPENFSIRDRLPLDGYRPTPDTESGEAGSAVEVTRSGKKKYKDAIPDAKSGAVVPENIPIEDRLPGSGEPGSRWKVSRSRKKESSNAAVISDFKSLWGDAPLPENVPIEDRLPDVWSDDEERGPITSASETAMGPHCSIDKQQGRRNKDGRMRTRLHLSDLEAGAGDGAIKPPNDTRRTTREVGSVEPRSTQSNREPGAVHVRASMSEPDDRALAQDNAQLAVGAGQTHREGGEPMVSAYLIGDIIQAEAVVPEEPTKHKKCLGKSQKRVAITLLGAFAFVAILLISLGATGHLAPSRKKEEDVPQDPTPEEPQACLADNCWIQLGPDLEGRRKGDSFGRRMSLSRDGRRVAVSANDERGDNSGLVVVYDIAGDIDLNTSSINQVGQDISGLIGDEVRGVLSGDGLRLAVGAPTNDGADGTLGSAGQLRVFELRDGNWTVLGDPIYGESYNEHAGSSFALSEDGSIVAVGAPKSQSTGLVRIYEYSNSSWIKLGKDIIGENAGDEFGGALSLSKNGSIVAIGARYHDGNGIRSGHVQIYNYSMGTWSQLGNDIEGDFESDHFGRIVSLSADGRTIAVKASSNDADGRGDEGRDTDDSGYVRVLSYDEGENAWHRIGTKAITGIKPNDYVLGMALSADGRRVAVGAGDVDGGAGYVRVFNNVGGEWEQLGGTIIGDRVEGSFGSTVALSGHGARLAIVDRMYGPEHVGIARIYEMPWTRIAYQEGAIPGDKFGFKVSIDAIGTRLAASASNNNYNGEKAGAVVVYDVAINGSLTRVGEEFYGLPGDGILGALSRDGRRIIIGGQKNDGLNSSQNDIGQVRVFEYKENTSGWALLGDAIYGDVSNDRAGKAFALSRNGTFAALSAIGSLGKGVVRVYQFEDMGWAQIGQDIEGRNPDDKFGWDISLSDEGTIIVIGSRHALNSKGFVSIYEYDAGNWTQVGSDIEGINEKDKFGVSTAVSADGNIVAAGATDAFGDHEGSGQVRIFSRVENATAPWQEIGGITGMRAALSGNGQRLAVGRGPDSWSRVYDYVGGSWLKVGGTITSAEPDSNIGDSVALSMDGTRLVVGSPAIHSTPEIPGAVSLFELPPIASRWI